MGNFLLLSIYSGSITTAAVVTFPHLHNNPQSLRPAALYYIGKHDMDQGRSLSSENTGGTTGARGMKNVDLAWSGCTCLIPDGERVHPPATAVDYFCTFLCTHSNACLTCELTQLPKLANSKVNKVPSSSLVKRNEISGQLQCPRKSHPSVPRKYIKIKSPGRLYWECCYTFADQETREESIKVEAATDNWSDMP